MENRDDDVLHSPKSKSIKSMKSEKRVTWQDVILKDNEK